MPDTAGLGDLWIRASRLVERCDVSLGVTAHPPGWRVVVRPRDGGPHGGEKPVEGTGEHLIEAVAAAINRAEAAGFLDRGAPRPRS